MDVRWVTVRRFTKDGRRDSHVRKHRLVIIDTLIVVFLLSSIMLPAVMFLVPISENASAKTLYVGGSGFGNYSTIQEAIDVADPGETIFVYNDSAPYNENVVVNKTINLIGEDRNSTMIDGGGSGDVILITADWVNISGFTIIGSGFVGDNAGLKINSDHNTLSGNNLVGNWINIFLWNSSWNNISDNTMIGDGIYIRGNKIEHWNTHDIDTTNTVFGKPVYYWKNRTGGTVPLGAAQIILANCINVEIENQALSIGTIGIKLGFSSYNNITGNEISDFKYYGIYLYNSSGNNIICNNVSSNQLYDIHLDYSNGNHIIGNNVSSSHEGIYLFYSNRNNIADNNMFSNAEGIRLGSSENNIIKGNKASNNSNGIYLYSSSNNNIEDNNVFSNGHGVYLRYSNGNNITTNEAFSNSEMGIHLKNSNKNNIIGNSASNNMNGIFLDGSGENKVFANSASNHWIGTGIVLYWCPIGNKVTGNNASNNAYGIVVKHTNGSDLIGNKVSSNICDGVYVYKESNDNAIIGNKVLLNNWDGIHLYELSTNNTIANNEVSSNNWSGIHIDYCKRNKIISNDISGNLEGLNVSFSSHNGTITSNIISNNVLGIRLWWSSSNNVTKNVISDNLEGLNVSSSSNNKIYHNNFINNINQAYDDTNNGNQWDNSYPGGGNYWSDFDEPSEGAYDDFNGPNQDVLSGDGIVDKGFGGGGGKNPYVIDPDSQDDYPLMGPYKNYMILKQGWNLISMPSIQQEQNLTKVLASIDGLYDAVQWFDITDKNDPWKHYRPGKPYGNDLFKIKETMGFWIHIIPPGDTVFYYNGIKPSQNQKITLHPGWNMVGYPSLSNKIRTAALNNINFGSDVDSIWTHDAATQKWEEIDASDYFELGKGYWVHSKVTKVWEVPL